MVRERLLHNLIQPSKAEPHTRMDLPWVITHTNTSNSLVTHSSVQYGVRFSGRLVNFIVDTISES